MGNARIRRYDAHKDYDVYIDVELLNMIIRIYSEGDSNNRVVHYEGSVGKFIKERIPAEWMVELLPQLKDVRRISYGPEGRETYLERIK